MEAKEYDFIFLGAGCASLSIVMRMIQSGRFSEKKILLIDKDSKTKNDRTWCFWEQQPGFFEDIVYHKWNSLLFKTAASESINLEMGAYQYKMLRGIDFYEKCFSAIKSCKNIEVIHGNISFEETASSLPNIKLNNEPVHIDKKTIVFNSVYVPNKTQKDVFNLLQHFRGWIIESPQKIFNPDEGVLMDFRIRQDNGTSFVYVLPLSNNKALIEYTIFSNTVLLAQEYDSGLKSYMEEFLGLADYTILEKEFGIIPMTNENFNFFKNGMYYIGTAGGQTKPSTGYTFSFIQKQASKIVDEIIVNKTLLKSNKVKKRFHFYDSTLLHILSKNLLEGRIIFSTLFKKNKATGIFKFLDNETSLIEEIKLINSLPKKVFLKAGLAEFFKMILAKKKVIKR